MGTIQKILAFKCEHCPLCRYARNHPEGGFGRFMEWHGTWCPAWKAWKEVYGQTPAAKADRTPTARQKKSG